MENTYSGRFTSRKGQPGRKISQLAIGMQMLSLFLISMFSEIHSVSAQLQAQIGTGTTSPTAVTAPIRRSNATANEPYAYRVYLFTEDEVKAAGILPGSIITEVAWFKDNANTYNPGVDARLEVSMRDGVSLLNYTVGEKIIAYSGPGSSFVPVGAITFDGDLSNVPSGNWMPVPVSSFQYTGGGIEVHTFYSLNIDNVVGNPATGAFNFRQTSTGSGNNTVLYTNRTSLPDTTHTYTATYNRPNIRFTYTPPTSNAAVGALTSPSLFCPGNYEVKVTIQNNGGNVIDSVQVNWELDGVAQPSFVWKTPIDVFGSANGNTAEVTLPGGPVAFSATPRQVKVWTSRPNGVNDPVAADDTLNAIVRPGLSGSYTIGGANPDFSDLATAAQALNDYGICGPVTMNIRSGTYDGQVVLNNISGTDISNTITFRSETGNRDDVRITYGGHVSSSNYLIQLKNVDNIIFKHLTFEATGTSTTYLTLMEMADTVSSITVDSCRFKARASSSTGSSAAMIFAKAGNVVATNFVGGDLQFTNNHFWGGGTAIYLYGASNMLINADFSNNVIDSAGAQGVYFYYTRDLKMRNNVIHLHSSPAASTQYGGYIYYAYEGTTLTGNKIVVPGGTTAYGLYFQFAYGNASKNCVVANNVISAAGTTGASYGIYCNNNAFQKIYNNSVVLTGGSATTAYAGLFLYTNNTYSNNEVRNNVFANLNGGRAAFFYAGATSAGTEFSHNNIYTTGTQLVVAHSSTSSIPAGSIHSTIASWRAATGQGKHCLSYRPPFLSTTDLRVDITDSAAWAMNGRGVHIPGNIADFDGNPRPEVRRQGAPDLGAFEFTPTSVPPRATADPAVPVTGVRQVFTLGGDTVAAITWNSATPPSEVVVRQYSGAVPPALPGVDTMYFYVDLQAPGAPYDYDAEIYYKDIWMGNLKTEAGVRLMEQASGGGWVTYSGAGSAVDTAREIISATGLTATGLYTGTGEVCSGQPLSPVFVTPALVDAQCPGTEYYIEAADPDETSGISYQWQSAPSSVGPWASVSGATSLSYQTSPLYTQTYYRLRAVCNTTGDSSFSAAYEIPIVPTAQVTSTQDAFRCGSGVLELSATGTPGAVMYWYDKPAGGILLDTGTLFTTPVLTSNDTFYVAASASTRIERVPHPPIPTEYISIQKGMGLSFDVNNLVTINTVDMYMRNSSVNNNASVQIVIMNPNMVDTIYKGPVYNFSSAPEIQRHVVPVNASLSPGSYRMTLLYSGVSDVVRTISSSVGGGNLPYPYVSPSNAISITKAHGSTSNTNTVAYNAFYNWSISVPCESPRQPVVATLGASPAFEVSATAAVCNNDVASMTVVSPAANYDSVVWAPVAGLYTDPAASVPYTGGHAPVVYTKSTTPGADTFIASSFNTVTGCGNIDTAIVFIQPTTVTASANPPDICVNGATTLRLDHAEDYAPGSIQWQTSTDGTSYTNLTGANQPTHTTGMLSTTTYYRALIRNSAGSTCVAAPITVNVSRSEVVSTNSVIRCGADSVVLSAVGSPGTVLKWYNSIVGGSVLDTGTQFTTPFLSHTTTFYVSAEGGKRSSYLGRQYPTTYTSYDTGYISFDAYVPFTLESVAVYPIGTGSGSIRIELQTSAGAVLQSTTATVTGTAAPGVRTIVPLNFSVPAGGSMRLVLRRTSGNITGLRRESVPSSSTLFSYPFTASGIASVTGSGGQITTNKLYQFFYDWRISVPCESPRTAVTATITPAPAFTASASPATICAGDSTTLSGTSANTGYSYQWTPGNLAGNAVKVAPGSTIKYYVTARDNSGGPNDGCVNYDSVTVSVNQLPNAVITGSGNTTICDGDSTILFASTGFGYSYQWNKDGDPIGGANASTLMAKAAGAYTVSVTDGQSCTAESAPVTITVMPAPNPSISMDGGELITGNFSSYQWYKDGVLIPGATSQRHTPQSSGVYTVIVTDADGCPGESAPYYHGMTGVGSVEAGVEVNIFPNPASTTVHIEARIPVRVTVSSPDGKVVLHKVNVKDIDISQLADAVYMVRVTDMDGKLLKMAKLIKASR